jgi:CRP/FNR family cyclic AMP-dependent transcriptional regulator
MTAPFASISAPPLTVEQYITVHGKVVTLDAGSPVCQESEPVNRLYHIQHGSVELAIYAGDLGWQPFCRLGAGHVIGWSGLLPPYRWQLSARCCEDCEFLACDACALRERCDRDPVFAMQATRSVVRIVTSHIVAARSRLCEMVERRRRENRYTPGLACS